jgi:hypothetical protein
MRARKRAEAKAEERGTWSSKELRKQRSMKVQARMPKSRSHKDAQRLEELDKDRAEEFPFRIVFRAREIET